MTIIVGDRVTIKANSAHVAPGSQGTVRGIIKETGNLLVDVDGRGRVSFLPTEVEELHGEPVAMEPVDNGTESPLETLLTDDEPKKRTLSEEARQKVSKAQRERHARATMALAVIEGGDTDWTREAATAVRLVLGRAATAQAPTATLSRMLSVIKHLEGEDKEARA